MLAVAPSTVWQILKDPGISRAPRGAARGRPGFLRPQAQAMLALDFFTAGLLNGTMVYILAVVSIRESRPNPARATSRSGSASAWTSWPSDSPSAWLICPSPP
jgi:putative transposase